MALTISPVFPPPANAAPYAIDSEWCIGDSLPYINENFINFDSRILSLSENKFDKTGGTITGNVFITNLLTTGGNITTSGNVNALGSIEASRVTASQGPNNLLGINNFGPSFFVGDKVVIGTELASPFSGAIAIRNMHDGEQYFFSGYRWFDSIFTTTVRSGLSFGSDPINGQPGPADLLITGTLNVNGITASQIYAGALSVGPGPKSFIIDHPIKENTKLQHYCVESPVADILYYGKTILKNGQASVNIDEISRMSPGTVNALGTNLVVTSLQNQTGFARLKPTPIVDGQFHIICEDHTSTDEVSWVVMGERKDLVNKKVEF